MEVNGSNEKLERDKLGEKAQEKNVIDGKVPTFQFRKPIGGWLLFFVIVNALGIALSVPEIWNGMKAIFTLELPPGVAITVLAIAYLPVLALDILWVIVLFRLCAVKRNAIKFVKIMLVVTPIVSILGAFLGSDPINKVDTREICQLGYSIIGSCIWYAYFYMSKRVKQFWPKI